MKKYIITLNGAEAESMYDAQYMANEAIYDFWRSGEDAFASVGILNEDGDVLCRREWHSSNIIPDKIPDHAVAGTMYCPPYGYYDDWDEVYPDDYYIMKDIEKMGDAIVCCDETEVESRIDEQIDAMEEYDDYDTVYNSLRELWRDATAEDIIKYGFCRGKNAESIWYAVDRTDSFPDWGDGSYHYRVAVEMLKECGEDYEIDVVKEGRNPICEDVIEWDDIF